MVFYLFDGVRFMVVDLLFLECIMDSCKVGWGLCIIDLENIIIYGFGLYSFF